MAKIHFDIKFRPQIESGEYKVVTGDNRPVRIISWDKRVVVGRIEIVCLVPASQGDTETVQLYYPDGTLISGWSEKSKLFIITPEPELTESEDERMIKAIKHILYENYTDAAVVKGVEIGEIVTWLENQKEPIPIPDKFSGLKSLLLQYLQSAANRKNDVEIEDDTDLWGRKILDYVWKQDGKQTLENYKISDERSTAKMEGRIEGRQDVINNPEEYGLQKPAEWSEEDEEMLGKLQRLIILCREDLKYIAPREFDNLDSWLKSLRPQPKEDLDTIKKREYERGRRDGYWDGYKKAEENHNNSVAFHYDYPTSPSIKRSCYEGGPCTNPQMDCINCPRKTTGGIFNNASSSGDLTLKAEWKPSEEQMQDLFIAAREGCDADSPVAETLKSFYNDLKKLM